MAEIGRNAPCPCGSGKKYKKCCLAKDEARVLPVAGEVHRMDARLVQELKGYAQSRWAHAFADLHPGQLFLDGDQLTPEKAQLYDPYRVYVHRFEGRTLAGWYLAERGDRLSPLERAWLEAVTQYVCGSHLVVLSGPCGH